MSVVMVVIAIVAVVASAASTTVSYYQGEQAREDAKKAQAEQQAQADKQYALARENADRQKKQIAKAESEAADLQAKTDREREQTAMRMRKRGTAGEITGQSTILTSPLGVPGGAAGAAKSALGE